MFVEPSGVQGSACTRQPMDTLEQSGDTALEYVGMWQRHAIRSCTCGVCLCKSAHSLAPLFTGHNRVRIVFTEQEQVGKE